MSGLALAPRSIMEQEGEARERVLGELYAELLARAVELHSSGGASLQETARRLAIAARTLVRRRATRWPCAESG